MPLRWVKSNDIASWMNSGCASDLAANLIGPVLDSSQGRYFGRVRLLKQSEANGRVPAIRYLAGDPGFVVHVCPLAGMALDIQAP